MQYTQTNVFLSKPDHYPYEMSEECLSKYGGEFPCEPGQAVKGIYMQHNICNLFKMEVWDKCMARKN